MRARVLAVSSCNLLRALHHAALLLLAAHDDEHVLSHAVAHKGSGLRAASVEPLWAAHARVNERAL